MDDFVAAGHAYAAVRPAYFSSNVFWNLKDVKRGEVGLLYSDVKVDYLAPNDIDTVCGALLAEPRFQKPDEEGGKAKALCLCGPHLMSQRRAHEILAQKLGWGINIKEIIEEKWLGNFGSVSRPALDALFGALGKSHQGLDVYEEIYEEAVGNVRKHKEGEPMSFGERVEVNKEAFT